MKPLDCEFESEVLAAVLQSRWPERVDAHLRRHVSGCVICSDAVAVAETFDLARGETHALAVLPDSGCVWWFAQLRARREAAEAAARPITATQIIAFASAVGLLGACLVTAFKWFQSMGNWIVSIFAGFDAKELVFSAATLLVEHTALVLGIAAVVFLLPAAAYFAMGRD
jgi:hypothetical protein